MSESLFPRSRLRPPGRNTQNFSYADRLLEVLGVSSEQNHAVNVRDQAQKKCSELEQTLGEARAFAGWFKTASADGIISIMDEMLSRLSYRRAREVRDLLAQELLMLMGDEKAFSFLMYAKSSLDNMMENAPLLKPLRLRRILLLQEYIYTLGFWYLETQEKKKTPKTPEAAEDTQSA